MRTLDGSPRGDGDMRAVNKRLNEKIDVLSRRISRMPKVPEAAAGGIVGSSNFRADLGVASVGGQTFFAPTVLDLIGGDGAGVSVASWPTSPVASSLRLSVQEDGWYAFHGLLSGFWSPTLPPSADAWITWDGNAGFDVYNRGATDSNGIGNLHIRLPISTEPLNLTAGTFVYLAGAWKGSPGFFANSPWLKAVRYTGS